jgi:hypothetical protein
MPASVSLVVEEVEQQQAQQEGGHRIEEQCERRSGPRSASERGCTADTTPLVTPSTSQITEAPRANERVTGTVLGLRIVVTGSSW